MTFEEIVQRRLSRRGLLKAGLVATALGAGGTLVPSTLARLVEARGLPAGALTFRSIASDRTDEITVPEGYRARVLLSWGAPLFADVPEFDIGRQTAALQARRVGFNNDLLMFLPLPPGSGSSHEGLLWINHESTDGAMMFPGYDAQRPTAEQVALELAAHGGSVVHVRRESGGHWSHVVTSPYNRRITATTPMRISGPAAGDPLLRTAADPTGTVVQGMLNNCGGGRTPWGTVLTCEENFDQYFANSGRLPDPGRRSAHARYGLPEGESHRQWERYQERFDVAKHANEPFRFGWVVEVDPYDPTCTPVKRTALGRAKHEGANTALGRDGRVVVYTGDDERFQFVYKFISARAYTPGDRLANRDLLDAGTLYAARFGEDGTGTWLPLVYGQNALTEAGGFASQADVLIRTRDAGDAVGATKMDRAEDIEVNPLTGKVYMVMTNNSGRGRAGMPGVDAANPRAENTFGHIIEVEEDGNDPTATSFRWSIFLLAGDPADHGTYFAGFPKEQVSPIANPDNLTFDNRGNLWIATDGQSRAFRVNDGLFAVPTEGRERGCVRQFLSAVPGAEVTGPVFTPDGQTLFVSIQHPGEGGSLAAPASTWPHGPIGPARPSVIAVTRNDGGVIGD